MLYIIKSSNCFRVNIYSPYNIDHKKSF
jgi:hypothetical protein